MTQSVTDMLASAQLAATTKAEIDVVAAPQPAPTPLPPEPKPAAEQPAPVAEAVPPAPDNFVFRRNVSRDFASMEVSNKRFRPALETETPPAKLDFSTIQSEIRAVLSATSPTAAPRPQSREASLSWTEPKRLAVLTLGGATPEAGLALLREYGIKTLITAPGHPFGPSGAEFEILSVPDTAAAAPLAARLRARLAAGEQLAFHTESGLTGAVALLAAQFSTRRG